MMQASMKKNMTELAASGMYYVDTLGLKVCYMGVPITRACPSKTGQIG